MQLKDVLNGLSRPRILLIAARIGQKTYSRNKDLKRLIRARKLPKPEQAVMWLLKREGELEEMRVMGNAAYNMKLHIHIMAALLQELYLYSKENRQV